MIVIIKTEMEVEMEMDTSLSKQKTLGLTTIYRPHHLWYINMFLKYILKVRYLL